MKSLAPLFMLALQETPGLGPKGIEKVLSTIPEGSEPSSPSDLVQALQLAGTRFKEVSLPETLAIENAWSAATRIWESERQNGIAIIRRGSPQYPRCLLQVSNPPLLLHALGNVESLNQDSLAIAGARKPTDRGVAAARKLGSLFAREGYVVVSGLAEGIDTAAHRGALEVGGLTVAVLASGLDSVYPAQNQDLAEAILEKDGALVSAYSWGVKPNPGYFIARDRIQSGLSLGVLVVETGISGGTMHTVRACKEQGRTLIVVKHPAGRTDPVQARGNALLISEKQADHVFEQDEDLDLIRIALDRVKDRLSLPARGDSPKKGVQRTWEIEETTR